MKSFQLIRFLLVAIALVGAISASVVVHILTESWWFESVGFPQVFWTQISWKMGVWLGVFVLYTGLLLGTYAVATHITRDRPFQLLINGQRWTSLVATATLRSRSARPADRLQRQFPNRLMHGGAIAFALFLGFLTANSSYFAWGRVLSYLNASEFGRRDPIFQNDLGFYVFQLPLYEWLQETVLSLLLWAVVVTVVVYSLKGEFTLLRGWRYIVTGLAKVHLGTLLAAIAGVVAIGLWLERFTILYSPDGVVFGAGFTDVHARLDAYWFMVFLSLALMVTCVISLWQRTIILPVAGLLLYLVLAVLSSNIYPWLQQQFLVAPNELAKEAPYITHNLEFTRSAYTLDAVERRDFTVENQLDASVLQANKSTIDNIRLWDYRPLLATYRQLQEIRLYYRFQDVDIDRYTLGDLYQQVMLAPRELDYFQLPPEAQNWVNQRLKYTHGYGVVMSPVNRVAPNGLPEFLIKDIPPQSTVDVEIEQPGIYFGEKTDGYVLVGTTTDEFDFPQNEENATTRYSGKDGVQLRSPLHRLAYAIEMGNLKLLISNYLTNDSRILYHRNIQERARQIAPFLRYDTDPYMTIVDGRLQWILDAYTVSSRYPYSQPVARSNNFAESFQGSNIGEILQANTNYIRNSVKVVTDAYDGTMQFYIVDDTDPIAATYRRIFPEVFLNGESVPEGVRSHFRYPVDLFKIQAQMYLSYHMESPEEFYNREDLWRFPSEIYEDQPETMQPYYVIMKLAEGDRDEFILILPFTPVNKDNMIAWLSARSDGDQYGKLLLYEFPKQELVYGPSQIEARINQNPEISEQLTLWSQEGSRVLRGNLLVIPINQSLLYVEPIYLRAEQGELPELRRVIVSYNDQTVMEPSLEEAIAAIFGTPDLTQAPPPSSSSTASTPLLSLPSSPDLELAQQALEAYQNAQNALQQGDWASYGRYQAELGEILEQLNASGSSTGAPAP